MKAAFEFAAKNPAGNSMYHRLVSQCWDLLEFLFYAKDTDAYRLRFVPWKKQTTDALAPSSSPTPESKQQKM